MRVSFVLYAIILCVLVIAVDGQADTQASVDADVVSVHDGDSIVVDAHPWPGMTIRINVRVRGIDSPEIKGKCAAEINAAIIARDRMAELVQGGIRLENIRLGKYAGRVLADAISDAGSVGEILISEGLARPYDGGKRAGWCD
ncbi:MAG: thermonuclease family protein [Rhodospirillales bacterium]|nr:thermonuclease family protein [Rhodospirillales bacterium]